MEIIVKVGESDEPEFWSQDFSESLLSSVEAALLANLENEEKESLKNGRK